MRKILLILAFSFSATMFMTLECRSVPQKTDLKQEIDTCCQLARNHYNIGSYNTAYEWLLKALQLSKTFGDTVHISSIYSNMGNIYYRFNNYSFAKAYYLDALKFCKDSTTISTLLNNLGYIDVKTGNLDSAFYFLNHALQVIEQGHIPLLHMVFHSLATFYKEKKMYDSAIHYYNQSLIDAEKENKIDQKAESLSDLGKLFFEIKKLDRAVYYIGLSNTIAVERRFLPILMENYLTLARIAETEGQKTVALEYVKQYIGLKDSILHFENTAKVNQLQRQHEALKMERQVQQLIDDQQLNEQIIRYRAIIQWIMLVILILVGATLLILFFKNKKLNSAYKALVEKNLKIIEIQQESSVMNSEKYQKSALSNEMQGNLLERIYAVMNDFTVICDSNLSIEKLADLVQSNRAYVSQVINDIEKKNFRTFLNEYRIREVQRLFLELDLSKYTIESIALKVGFKSRSAFISAFKDVTGVSPSFYLKSI